MKLRLALVLLLCLHGLPARSSQTYVLIDRSGSMKDHYKETPDHSPPLVRELAESMIVAASAYQKPEIAVFDSTVVPLASLDDADKFKAIGQNTLLTSALTTALHGHRHVWLVTDNVQDVGGDEDMSNFYALLRSPQITSIHIFPVLESSNLHQQGVLVYAISTADHDENFDREVAAFDTALASRPRLSELHVKDLLMKPLGENAIQEKAEEDSTPLQFHEGEPLVLTTSVRIGPRFPYLYFESSPVTGADSSDGGDTQNNPFRDSPCLIAEKNVASVNPNKVRTDNADVYKVNIDFGHVHLKRSLGCIWSAAFVTSQVSKQIETHLTIRVPKENFRFTPAFIEEFTADTEQAAKDTGKIAGLRPLPGELADAQTVIPISVPISVVILYPSWPGLLLITLGILFIAAIIGIIFAAKNLAKGKGGVTVQLEGGPVLQARVKDHTLYVENRAIGQVDDRSQFTPALGVRLDGGTRTASTLNPFRCILADGRRIIITFGKNAGIGSAPQGRASAPTGNTRPSTSPRRR